jgi:pimeloyl-ACP methyl ester carboxylesterase
VDLVGHSLGGNVAALYAGVRPGRVAKLVNLEGFGLAPASPEKAPERYRRWLEELRAPPRLRTYASFDALADRLQANNPRLARDRADFLARHWGEAQPDGSVRLRADPAHKIVNPVLYRYEEVQAVWREVTAPMLWIEGQQSESARRLGLRETDLAERRAAFRRLQHEIVPDAGHMLHHDQPERVGWLIERFLGQT